MSTEESLFKKFPMKVEVELPSITEIEQISSKWKNWQKLCEKSRKIIATGDGHKLFSKK